MYWLQRQKQRMWICALDRPKVKNKQKMCKTNLNIYENDLFDGGEDLVGAGGFSRPQESATSYKIPLWSSRCR